MLHPRGNTGVCRPPLRPFWSFAEQIGKGEGGRITNNEQRTTIPRSAGILLHPTSLPGAGGIGTIGPNAWKFGEWLADAGMRYWQVLPLGPTGYGDSPYSALSALAGNPFLIALEPIHDAGWLRPEDLEPIHGLPETHIDFGRLVPAKWAVLRRAFAAYQKDDQSAEFERFKAAQASWLEEVALFLALKDEHGGAPWYEWQQPFRSRDPKALATARVRLAHDIEFHRFVQFQFFSQWSELKKRCSRLGVKFIGDIPIFVAHDSSDVWANQRLFKLDWEGRPTVLAGVPPDYFSPTGQLWGNPHYHWDRMEQEGFAWWIERFRMLLQLVDVIRLDHFRGFAGAWEVPAGEDTAVEGEWIPGPGAKLFDAIRSDLGNIPIIAEDLGVITPDVVALREQFGFPGMIILQFAFGTDAANPSLPHNARPDTVIYTGTHDNETTVGWFSTISDEERSFVKHYTGSNGVDIGWDLIRLALGSVSSLAVSPLQDVLRLGSAARMNLPGRASGNWSWRFTEGDLNLEQQRDLRTLAVTYGRSPRT
jgi:4-alpha-glucanotransferase